MQTHASSDNNSSIEFRKKLILSDYNKLHSMDIMEINPILDIQNRTAQMAVNLTASLFGKKIL